MTGPDRVAFQVGKALRRLRDHRRCRQYRLAAAAGITPRQLRDYENGRDQPNVATLTAVLTALDCTADEFGRHLGPWGILPAIPA